MRDLLVLMVNLAGLALSLVKVEYALAFYQFLAFGRLQDFAFGFATTQPWSMIAALATLFTMVRTGIWLPWRDSWITRIVLALAVWIAFTTSIGVNPAAGWEVLSQFLKVLLMFFVACRVIDTGKKIKLLLMVVVGAFMFHGVKFGLYGMMKGFAHNLLGPGGQMGDNNSFGMAMATTLPLVLYALGQLGGKWGRLALLGYLPMHIVAIVCTYSRGAFINLALGTMVLLFFSKHRIRNMILFPLLIAAAVPLLPQAYFDRISTIKDTGESGNETSNASRMMLFQYGMNLFQKHAILGSGHDGYMTAAYMDLGPGYEQLTHHLPHNALILIGVEAGALGLILHVSLFALTLAAMARLSRDKWVSRNLPVYSALARALLAGTAGYFVNSLFNNYPYHELGYFLILMSECLRFYVGRMKERNLSRAPSGKGPIAASSVNLPKISNPDPPA
jgi:putative inorganic carbon (hco3(-)) transporter